MINEIYKRGLTDAFKGDRVTGARVITRPSFVNPSPTEYGGGRIVDRRTLSEDAMKQVIQWHCADPPFADANNENTVIKMQEETPGYLTGLRMTDGFQISRRHGYYRWTKHIICEETITGFESSQREIQEKYPGLEISSWQEFVNAGFSEKDGKVVLKFLHLCSRHHSCETSGRPLEMSSWKEILDAGWSFSSKRRTKLPAKNYGDRAAGFGLWVKVKTEFLRSKHYRRNQVLEHCKDRPVARTNPTAAVNLEEYAEYMQDLGFIGFNKPMLLHCLLNAWWYNPEAILRSY